MTPQISDTPAPETLRFGYGHTVLGTILVTESAHGVVALFIGDDRAKLLRDLNPGKAIEAGVTLVVPNVPLPSMPSP